jgi:hypothetical protein
LVLAHLSFVADDPGGGERSPRCRYRDMQEWRVFQPGWQRNAHEKCDGCRTEERVSGHPQLERFTALAKRGHIDGRVYSPIRSGQILTTETTTAKSSLNACSRGERPQREVRRKWNA